MFTKENGYMLLGVACLCPIAFSFVDAPAAAGLLMSGFCVLFAILCFVVASRREAKKARLASASDPERPSYLSGESRKTMGKQIFTVDDQVIPTPNWAPSGVVAAGFIALFMAVMVSLLTVAFPYGSNITLCIIVWGVAGLVMAFAILVYHIGKQDSLASLQKNDEHMRKKADLVAMERDKQNRADRIEYLEKEKELVLERGYRRWKGAAPQKEGDWAIAGGVAQAIGGIGAGLFAAAATIGNNAKIRQENEERAAFQQMSQMLTAMELNDIDRQIAALQRTKDEPYTFWEAAEGLFTTLEVTKAFYRSAWGPVIVRLEIRNTHNATIYGSLDCVLSHHGVQVGSCAVLLPDEGIEPNAVKKCYALCRPPKIDRFAYFNKLAVKDPWHDAMEITGHKLWTRQDPRLMQDVAAGFAETLAKKKGKPAARPVTEQKQRMSKTKKCAIILSCALAVVLGIGLYLGIPYARYQKGLGFLEDSPALAHKEFFSKLPLCYYEKIADNCISCAKPLLNKENETQRTLSYLNLADKYAATAEQRKQITQMYVSACLLSKDAAAAEEYILRQYSTWVLSPSAVTEYAKTLHAFASEDANVVKAMQESALRLVQHVRSRWEEADVLAKEWDVAQQEYEQMVECFLNRDYQTALAYFDTHRDVEFGPDYLGFCRAAAELFGTWKDDSGNTLVITYDPDKEIEYLSGAPYELYLKIALNGKDISYFSDTIWWKGHLRQCKIKLSPRVRENERIYETEYVDVFSPYEFELDDHGQLTVTHQSVRKTHRIEKTTVWTKIFTKAE